MALAHATCRPVRGGAAERSKRAGLSRLGETGPVPSTLPAGDPAPADGSLPPAAAAEVGRRPLGIYLHVPFCAARCGYCDFNTYTADELGDASPAGFVDAALAEIRLARHVLGDGAGRPPRSSSAVGRPRCCQQSRWLRLLRGGARGGSGSRRAPRSPPRRTRSRCPPRRWSSCGRLGSRGSRSACRAPCPHVLSALDRRHTPGRLADAVGWARRAGFDDLSLDLIYGAHGESVEDWRTSVEAAVALGPEHVSAYALIVEDGTRLAARDPPRRAGGARRRRAGGQVPAGRRGAHRRRAIAGTRCRTGAAVAGRRRHNVGYWVGDDWWGVGPGAHSHVAGVRWWNVKHPTAYAGRLAAGRSAGCRPRAV